MEEACTLIVLDHAECTVRMHSPLSDIFLCQAAREFEIFQAVRRRYHDDLIDMLGKRDKTAPFQIIQSNIFIFEPLLQFCTESARFEELAPKEQHMPVRIVFLENAFIQQAFSVPNIVGNLRLFGFG